MGMQARFYFYVYCLEVDASAFGKHGPIDIDGRDVTLDIPRWREDYSHRNPNFDIGRAWSRKKWDYEDGPITAAEVIYVCVAVDLHADFLVDEIIFDTPESRAKFDAVSSELDPAWASAKKFLSLFLEWVSVDSLQSQHATAARIPPSPAESGEVRIYDRNGDMSDVSIGLTPYDDSPWPMGRLLTRADADEIVRRMKSGERPSTTRQLLADAELHAFHAVDRNQGVALVLAAVACEMAVKSRLRELSSNEQAALVDLALGNPRDVTLAAIALYDKGVQAVVGRTLRVDEPPLYKALTKLFEHRNAFAHGRSKELTEDDVRADLKAARDALDYLDALPGTRSDASDVSQPVHGSVYGRFPVRWRWWRH